MRPLPGGKHVSVGRAGVDYAQRAPAKKAIWSATRNRLARLAHPPRDLRSNRRVGQSGPSVPTLMAGGSIHRSQACLTTAPASAHRVVVYIDTRPHCDIRMFHWFVRDIRMFHRFVRDIRTFHRPFRTSRGQFPRISVAASCLLKVAYSFTANVASGRNASDEQQNPVALTAVQRLILLHRCDLAMSESCQHQFDPPSGERPKKNPAKHRRQASSGPITLARLEIHRTCRREVRNVGFMFHRFVRLTSAW